MEMHEHQSLLKVVPPTTSKPMKSLVIYGSTLGNTRLVVKRLPELLKFSVDIVDVKTLADSQVFHEYDLLLFFSSTWGDGELQADMESFLVREALRLDGKPYAICELGNYYGYDDFNFSTKHIQQKKQETARNNKQVEPFSMDSLPYKDWVGLSRWYNQNNKTKKENKNKTWMSFANCGGGSAGI